MPDSRFPSLTAVVSRFPAPSQTFIRRKLHGLRDAGMDVTVAATVFHPGAEDEGFELQPLLPWGSPRSMLRQPNRSALLAAAGRTVHLSRRPDPPGSIKRRATVAPLLATETDIVHFEFSGIAVSYLDVLDRLAPARLAVSCRGAAEQIVPRNDPTRAPLLAEVFDRADLVHCVSDDIRATVVEMGAPEDRIVVNRPAVPVRRFSNLASGRMTDEHSGPLRILSVGRLHWKKGFDDALRAIATLVASGHQVEYRIAGEGPEREKLSFLIEELDLGGIATLLGSCTEDQILDELGAADTLLLPSLSEGISNAVLEAMAAGLPVVATDCGGMAEVIDHGVDGFLVPVGGLDSMTHHLGLLASDQDLRHRLGAAAAARAVDEFDLSRQVEVFLAAYRALGVG